jgi:hypothetical protein
MWHPSICILVASQEPQRMVHNEKWYGEALWEITDPFQFLLKLGICNRCTQRPDAFLHPLSYAKTKKQITDHSHSS